MNRGRGSIPTSGRCKKTEPMAISQSFVFFNVLELCHMCSIVCRVFVYVCFTCVSSFIRFLSVYCKLVAIANFSEFARSFCVSLRFSAILLLSLARITLGLIYGNHGHKKNAI